MQIFFRHLHIASIALLSVLLIPATSAYAQEANSIIPNLFVRNIQVKESGSQYINGSFTILSKAQNITGGIGYTMMLMSALPELPEGELFSDNPIIYSKTYVPENLTIAAGEAREVPFYYSFNPIPSGTYRIRIQLSTDNGREMGWWDQNVTVGSPELASFVELQPTAVIVESIDPSLANIPEGRRSEWNPLEGVNVNPKAELQLQMNVKNTAQTAFSGQLAAVTQRALTTSPQRNNFELGTLTLSPGESRQVDIAFSAPDQPGAYQVMVSARNSDGSLASSLGEYRVVVRGASASVISVIPRELSVKKGGTMALTAHIVGAADTETIFQGTVEISALNSDEVVGSSMSTVELSYEPISIDASIKLESDIIETPGARITISDTSGSVLEIYEVQFDKGQISTSSEQTTTAPSNSIYRFGVAALAVLAIAVIALLWIRGKKPDTSVPPALFLIPLAMGTLALLSIHGAYASHEAGISRSTGNSMVVRDGKVSAQESGTSGKGTALFVNAPIHEDIVEPGQTVQYQATSKKYACGNDYYYNRWLVHVATDGGKVSSHDNSSWEQVLAFPEVLVKNSKTTLIRNVVGNIIMPDIPNADDTTVWSEVWWRKDDPGRQWELTSLFTWLNLQSSETDLSITKSGPATIEQDEAIAYTITVENKGDADAKNVEIRDEIPAGLAFDPSQSGAECFQEANDVVCVLSSLSARTTKSILLTFVQGTRTVAPLITPAPSAPSGPTLPATYKFVSRTSMVDFVNSLGQFPYLIPNGDDSTAFLTDGTTADKLCELKGYSNVAGYTSRKFSSPGDNTITHWDASKNAWVVKEAVQVGNAPHLDTLTCKDPFGQSTSTPTPTPTPSPTPVATPIPLACGTIVTNTATVTSDNGDPSESNNASSTATTVTCPPPATGVTVTLLFNGSAKPADILANTPATLSWSSTNATSCKALRDWSGNKATSGSESTTPTEVRKYSYRLNCTNSTTGETGHKIVDVNVIAGPTTANQPPIAVAAIEIDGRVGTIDNPVEVTQGKSVNVRLLANGSSDPDGWNHATLGVSNGGTCQWNSDLNQGTPTYDTTIANPSAPDQCTINLGSLTFSDSVGVYTYELLKIIDAVGGISNSGKASVKVISANYQCNDGIDNADTEDTLIDSADPGCHKENDINKDYVPSDDDETNPPSNNDGGGNNGGGNNGGGNNGGGNNGGGSGPGGVVETR